ncbi:molybdopterin molybdenumtransferase MoeA [Paenibacillus pinisoli]|uniref:Molybdopterin molybdenumtransferase n=2 Tax=Paenibacillus pinisoli TaxID=1276110 RepID=A0A3A6PTW9_9BACL|nr:gephyrin-like molybdotransferase Glp [Paenibacillus pinisoli]RJX41719.1 molybdopterin molybdenumtransferase MoeA [Paenibacillus pinisoli]
MGSVNSGGSDGRFNRRAITVDEAQRRVLAAAARTASGHVPLAAAGGRRLAQQLLATSVWPPFARAGLDGYAVRAADTAEASPQSPAALRVVDTVAAGGLALAAVQPGTAARIMTGAPVPPGADAVVMLEQTAEGMAGGERTALVKAAARPGQNVAPQGEEFRLGSAIAGPGELLRPGHIALLATFGYASVPVYRRPRVAIFATGNELLPVEAPLAPGHIRDSNSAMVAAMIRQHGGEPLLCGALPDEPAAVREALRGIGGEADMIVTTGGVSVGDYDAMALLLRSLPRYEEVPGWTSASPETLLFNRVSMRPGSPTSAAWMDGKLVLALSGNPGACFTGFELLGVPALRAMQGDPSPYHRKVHAQLAREIGKGSPHDRYVRVSLQYGEDGRLYADPLAFGKSSMTASLAEAEALAVIPSGSSGAEAGRIVEAWLLT